jgi:hypothetical protein
LIKQVLDHVFQYKFVINSDCLDESPRVSVQNYLDTLFSENFLAVKAVVVKQKGLSADKTLTPNKEDQKIVLFDLQYLVMQPLLCK